MKSKLNAKLCDIEVESEYRGTVYEQTAKFEIDGVLIEVYDDHQRVTRDLIGKQLGIAIRILSWNGGVRIIEAGEKKISDPREQISKWSYDFCGEITDKEEGTEYSSEVQLLLDVGYGEVLFSPPNDTVEMIENGDIEVGEFLCVTASRTEIAGILPD